MLRIYIHCVKFKFYKALVFNLATLFRRIGSMSNITLYSPAIVQCLSQLFNVCLETGFSGFCLTLYIPRDEHITWHTKKAQ